MKSAVIPKAMQVEGRTGLEKISALAITFLKVRDPNSFSS